jgi:septum site-determining protein MinC
MGDARPLPAGRQPPGHLIIFDSVHAISRYTPLLSSNHCIRPLQAEVHRESFLVSSQAELNLKSSAARNSAPIVDKPHAPIDIRFGQLGVLQLRLRTLDPGVILDELSGRFSSAPQFFRRAAVCIDLLTVKPLPDLDELRAIIDAVSRTGMIPIGLAGEATAVEPLAVAVKLPVLSALRLQARPGPVLEPAQPEPEPEPESRSEVEVEAASSDQPAAEATETPGSMALLHTQMVRSGQRVYARHRDLIVSAGVASGSEVMADGCVHVYGSLRGRAIAGTRGDTAARIFCQEFHAELVSIAGVFRIFETIPSELSGKPVQVWLDGEKLHCTRIGA